MSDEGRFACACCGFLTLSTAAGEGSYELCPVCYWEDDGVQFADPDYPGGANDPTLNEARENYRSMGASERCFVNDVRAPRPEEHPPA